MQQIAAGFGAMQQENTTRKAEWEEFQQRVDAERVELTTTIMDRISMMESESEALRAELSESQGRSSNVSTRDAIGRRATIHGHVEGIRLPKGWGDSNIKAKFNDKPSENIEEFLDAVTFDVQVLDPKIQGLAIYHQLGATVQSSVRRLAKSNDSLIRDVDALVAHLRKRYHKPQFALIQLDKLIYEMKQTTSLSSYISQFDEKAAVLEFGVPDVVKKVILLHNMHETTRTQIMQDSAMLESEYAEFCAKASLIDDALYESGRKKSVKRVAVSAVNRDRELDCPHCPGATRDRSIASGRTDCYVYMRAHPTHQCPAMFAKYHPKDTVPEEIA